MGLTFSFQSFSIILINKLIKPDQLVEQNNDLLKKYENIISNFYQFMWSNIGKKT